MELIMKNRIIHIMRFLNALVMIFSFIGADFTYVRAFAETNETTTLNTQQKSAVTRTVEPLSYEDEDFYDFSDNRHVDTMSYGKKSFGSLNVSGIFNTDDNKRFNDKTAFGVEEGGISLSYLYDKADFLKNNNLSFIDDWQDEIYENYDDDETIKAGEIGEGCLIVQKSSTAIIYETVQKTVNLFGNNLMGVENFYTSDGIDLNKGIYYRIIVAYGIRHNKGTTKILFWDKEKHEDRYYVEVYEFYACTNNGRITITDLKTKEKRESDEGYLSVVERFGKGAADAGATLLNNSTATGGFEINRNNCSYSITVNDKPYEDGKKYDSNGKYEIKVKTKLGYEPDPITVYVFDGGNDMGKSTYFEDFLLTEKRVFSTEYDVPLYAVGPKIKIKAVKDYVPALTGAIVNKTSKKTIRLEKDNRKEQTYTLEKGEYKADLYSGNTESGSVFHYTFNFVVDGEAEPRINKNLLGSYDSDNSVKLKGETYKIWDNSPMHKFSAKHYEVKLGTAGGGSIYICLPTYNEAYEYAFQIEKNRCQLNIDKNVIEYDYDQDDTASNQKKEYEFDTLDKKLKLTNVLNRNAKKNIEIAYFNSERESTFRTFDDEKLFKDQSNKILEEKAIKEDVRVFPSEYVKQDLLDIKPYLNGFTFIQVGDYESDKVSAYCENTKKTYALEYGKPVDDQLKTTSKYTVTETTKYGDSIKYTAYYMAENQTETVWNISKSGRNVSEPISNFSHKDIEADSVTLYSVKNEYDDNAIMTVNSRGVYDDTLTCLCSEAEGLILYKKGTYEVTFTDRVGNSFTQTFKIKGDRLNKSSSIRTFTDVYNSVHIQQNSKITEEDKQ